MDDDEPTLGEKAAEAANTLTSIVIDAAKLVTGVPPDYPDPLLPPIDPPRTKRARQAPTQEEPPMDDTDKPVIDQVTDVVADAAGELAKTAVTAVIGSKGKRNEQNIRVVHILTPLASERRPPHKKSGISRRAHQTVTATQLLIVAGPLRRRPVKILVSPDLALKPRSRDAAESATPARPNRRQRDGGHLRCDLDFVNLCPDRLFDRSTTPNR